MSQQNQIPLSKVKHKNQVEDRFNPDKFKVKAIDFTKYRYEKQTDRTWVLKKI